MTPFEVVWNAPEFEHNPKEIGWYWASMLIAAAMIGVALWQQNFLFLFFILIAEILVLEWAGREPKMLRFVFNERGITIGEHIAHPVESIENFSIEESYREEWAALHLRFHNKLRVPIVILLPKDIQKQLRENLKGKVPEVEVKPSLLELVEQIIGF